MRATAMTVRVERERAGFGAAPPGGPAETQLPLDLGYVLTPKVELRAGGGGVV